MIVTGGVNAGKTTLLRALASEIPPSERIATLESPSTSSTCTSRSSIRT